MVGPDQPIPPPRNAISHYRVPSVWRPHIDPRWTAERKPQEVPQGRAISEKLALSGNRNPSSLQRGTQGTLTVIFSFEQGYINERHGSHPCGTASRTIRTDGPKRFAPHLA